MLTFFQAIVLGLTQGVTELFPISSLGHSVLIPGLLGWNISQNSETFLEFLVATHLATAIVLFIIYFKDWVRIVKGIFRSLAAREISDRDPDAKLGWLLVVSTIPAGIIGLLLKKVQSLLKSREEKYPFFYFLPLFSIFFVLYEVSLMFFLRFID